MRLEEIAVLQRKRKAIDVVMAKHRNPNLALSHILESAHLTPGYFYNAVLNPDRLIEDAPQDKVRNLQSILTDTNNSKGVLRMDFDFLKRQYHDIQSGRAKKYVQGTLNNQENVEDLIYIAITSKTPYLNSDDRRKVVEGISKLKTRMSKYLKDTGVLKIYTAWKKRYYGKESSQRDVSVMELFDNARRRIKEDRSLFDLAEPQHANLWQFWYGVRKSYWDDAERASSTAFEVLSNHNARLRLRREIVIEELKKIENPKQLFRELGLADLMKEGYEGRYKGSELAVLAAFDDGYRDSTGNIRLFGWNVNPHLHEWDFRVPLGYWNILTNRQRAVYHGLVEYDSGFGSRDASESVQAFRRAKSKGSLKKLFVELGLAGLRAEIGSNYEMFRLYDNERKQRGMPSILRKIKKSEIMSSGHPYKYLPTTQRI